MPLPLDEALAFPEVDPQNASNPYELPFWCVLSRYERVERVACAHKHCVMTKDPIQFDHARHRRSRSISLDQIDGS